MSTSGTGPTLIEFAEFAQLVRDMLEAQQRYFKSGKDVALLFKAKAIEAKVRDAIAAVLDNNQQQLNL